MMKPWLLKLHRWTALTFALPLVLVLATGLVLSFEPWLVERAMEPGFLTPAKIEAALSRHDPSAQARTLVFRSYDRTLTIRAGRGGGMVVDMASGEALPGPSALADLLTTARRIHETLLIEARWLVVSATAAMLALAALGVLMGLPRFSNTLAGWHKAFAWGLLPLVVLSPLTGLLMSAGVTFTGPASGGAGAGEPRGAALPLVEAVRIVGTRHDLSTLIWLRPQGGRMLARLDEGGEYRVYAVTREGTIAQPRNWPRLWHEGDYAGAWSSLINAVTALALIGLLTTGPLIWLRRRIKARTRRVRRPAMAG